jgi:hypothetical protein
MLPRSRRAYLTRRPDLQPGQTAARRQMAQSLGAEKAMANFIKKAIRHPGALTAAAARRGVSKREEAEKESHSSNPHIRTRGILGKRFMKGGDLSR